MAKKNIEEQYKSYTAKQNALKNLQLATGAGGTGIIANTQNTIAGLGANQTPIILTNPNYRDFLSTPSLVGNAPYLDNIYTVDKSEDEPLPKASDLSKSYPKAGVLWGERAGVLPSDTTSSKKEPDSETPVTNANSGDTRWKDKAKEYLSQLQALQAQVNNPTDKWTPMLEQIYAQLSNVEYPTMPQFNGPEFQYDYRDDPAYQQYRQQYIRNGQLAMQDTMGQAAGLTGGYGSSYAQNVGQSAYQNYMNQLNAVVPQLYQNAYNRYADDYTRQYTEFKDRYSADVDRYNAETQNIKDQLNYTMQMADDDWKRRQQEFNNEMALREESENNNRWWTQYAGNTGGSYNPETGLYTAPENTSSGLTFDQTMQLNKFRVDNPDGTFDDNYNYIPPITYDGRTDTDLANEAVAYLQDNKKYKQVMKQYGNKELSQEDAEKYFMPVIEDVMKQLDKAGWTVTQRQYAREQFINALIYGGNQ